jgi:uncharacterized membrane protein YhaH (DUF805 family)
MGFTEAVSSAFRNYFNFSGRAPRSEYWYYTLFLFIVAVVAVIIDFGLLGAKDIGPANAIFTLATIIPSLAMSVRRLHDIGRTGWWLLISFVPLIGIILLIYWACQPSDQGPNLYGERVV